MNYSTTGKYTFRSWKSSTPPDFLNGINIAFVGAGVDDRGSASIGLIKQSGCHVHTIRFEASSQETYIDDHQIRRESLRALLVGKDRILLDATTLGLGEMLQVLLAGSRAACNAVEFLYAEPQKYTQKTTDQLDDLHLRNFSLTESCRFSAVLGFGQLYEPKMAAVHIFFLGFEPGRIQNALEERGDFDKNRYRCHVIIGMPAFKAGWESNTIRPHLAVLEDLQLTERSITYCQANSIRESYLTLWELYRQLGDERSCFFVSPMGTKPHTIGAALFLMETRGSDIATSLYYDHPVRIGKRSSDIAIWHHVHVELGSASASRD